MDNLCWNTGAGQRARRSMVRHGVTPKGSPLWTADEVEICKKFWPDLTKLEIELPGRSRAAIGKRCRDGLGLYIKPNWTCWTAADVSRLRRIYPSGSASELIEAFPGRRLLTITRNAYYHGIRRRRKPYTRTGNAELDAIRVRCFTLGITMPELDLMARSIRYFGSMGWKHGWINHAAIARAVHVLDGKMTIEWSDL